METAEQEGQVEEKGLEVSPCDKSAAASHTSRKKRKRKQSGGETGDHAKHHGGKHGHRPPNKRFKHNYGMSSTKLANNIMRFRLGGSVSDPLNLEGDTKANLGDDCSTCAPSPAAGPEVFGQPSPLPLYLQHDPLNLEGKTEDFPTTAKKHVHHGLHHHSKHGKPGHKKKTGRRRTVSKTEDHEKQEEGGASGSGTAPPLEKPLPTFNSKTAKFRYGNYDRYYGYRNSGASEEDVRLSMLRREWFVGKDCLDIGSNTGQITTRIARDFAPKKIVGMDIDSKLVKIAWKNLYRDHFPAVAPDGRPFPLSLVQARGPMCIPLSTTEAFADSSKSGPSTSSGEKSEAGFPRNVEFVLGNYVPASDSALDSIVPEYDVILGLSLTKWIHLNWGDDGIKRFFRKVYLHLRPGGRFIVEPQPLASYAKKKKVTEDIYQNYQRMKFHPNQFHSYLLSPEVGFHKHRFIGIPENKSKGFRRPLHMYMKAESVGGVDHTHPDVGACDSPLSDEAATECPRRLKSVVVVQERTLREEKSDSKGDSVDMETEEGGAKGGAEHGNNDEP